MITIKQKIHFGRGKAGCRRIASEPPATESVPMGRVPRVSKLMALAIRFDRLIREGNVADRSELARLAHVTQPRMTQIMNLLHLAPDIQEDLLFLPPVTEGRAQITRGYCVRFLPRFAGRRSGGLGGRFGKTSGLANSGRMLNGSIDPAWTSQSRPRHLSLQEERLGAPPPEIVPAVKPLSRHSQSAFRDRELTALMVAV
jgi:hypothetical protein